ncbi:MAG: FG-GAP-like repeat-containing protein [Planctomycetota bacterium]
MNRIAFALVCLLLVHPGCAPSVPEEPKKSKPVAEAERIPATLVNARQALVQGQLKRAESLCRELLVADPGDVDSSLLLVSVFVQSGRYEEALQRLSGLVEENPGSLDLRRRYASLLNERGFRFDANEQLRFLAARQPLSVRELIALINPTLTWVSFAEKPDWRDRSFVAQNGVLNVVAALRAAGDVREAIECLENHPLYSDGHPAAVAMMGWLLAENQRETELTQWATNAGEEPKRYPAYWIGMGNLFLLKQQPDIAKACFAQALRREPGSMTAAAGLSQATVVAGPKELTESLQGFMTRLNESQVLAFKIGSSDQPPLELAKEMGRVLNEMGRPVESVAWQESIFGAMSPGSEIALQLTRYKAKTLQRFPSGLDAGKSLAVRVAERSGTEALDAALDQLAAGSGSPDSSKQASDVAASPSAQPVLADIAVDSGIDFRYRNASTRIEKEFRLFEALGGGVACVDYDLDGHVDLYLGQGGCDPPAEPSTTDKPASSLASSNRLFRSLGGKFVDRTTAAGLVRTDYTLGVSAGDWNGDGFQDLLVGNVGTNTLWLNQGDGTFQNINLSTGTGSELETVTASVAIADVTGDGLADLVEANYVTDARVFDAVLRDEQGEAIALPGPKQFRAAMSHYRVTQQDGSLDEKTFGDASAASTGLGLLIGDLDGDARSEVFIANDQNANHLWNASSDENLNGLDWTETATALGCGYGTSGKAMACMGIAAADFDHNGWPDLHITNFLGERSNLYLQQEGGTFSDAAIRFEIDQASVSQLGFGTQAFDFDNDGWSDLFVGNGHIEDFRYKGKPFRMPPQLLINRRTRFVEAAVEPPQGFWSSKRLSRGVARLDWNRDGRVDVAVGDLTDRFALLENRTTDVGRSLQLELIGVECGRDAIGATVLVHGEDQTRCLPLTSGDGYLAKNESVIFVGLRDASEGDENAFPGLTVRWPGGAITHWQPESSGRYVLVQDQGKPWKRW